MSEWFWVWLIAVSGVSFLFGRWRGIKDFEAEMVKRKLLPPEPYDEEFDRMPTAHTCAHGKCAVRLYDPKEKYCQHHEANIAFGVESEGD